MNTKIRKLIRQSKPWIRVLEFPNDFSFDDTLLFFNELGFHCYETPEFSDSSELFVMVSNQPITFRRYVNWGKANDNDWPQDWVKSNDYDFDRDMLYWKLEA